MSNKGTPNIDLISMGLGVFAALGIIGVVVELLPILLIGGGAYLVIIGLKNKQ